MAAYHGSGDAFFPSSNIVRRDFRDSPLLQSGSGSQATQPSLAEHERELAELQRANERMNRLGAMPPFTGQAKTDAPPNVQRTLLEAGEILGRAIGTLGRIEALLDDWEEDAPRGSSVEGVTTARHPNGGIRQAAKGLHAQALTIGERIALLQGRLSALKDGIGGL